jgi:hypothetical protein
MPEDKEPKLEDAPLGAGDPQASYVSPDLSFHDGTGIIPDSEKEWHEERNKAHDEEVKAAVESEQKVVEEREKAAEAEAKEAEAEAKKAEAKPAVTTTKS